MSEPLATPAPSLPTPSGQRPSPPRGSARLRRTIILAVIFLAFFMVAYVVYWKSVAGTMERQFLNWAGSHNTADHIVKFDGPKVIGFPFTFDMELGNFTYEHKDHVRFTSPNFRVQAVAWAPFRPLFTSDEASKLEILSDNQTYTAQKFAIRVVQPWIRPRSHRDTGLYLYADLSGIGLDPSLKAGLGDAVQLVSFKAKLKGDIPDVTDAVALNRWREDGGTIELSKVRLEWLPLIVEGDGTVSLDKDMQPLASFNAALSGYLETIDVLRDTGQIKPFPASLFKAALSLLEDPNAPKDQPRSIKVPVTVQNSTLVAAGIGITKWEPIRLP